MNSIEDKLKKKIDEYVAFDTTELMKELKPIVKDAYQKGQDESVALTEEEAELIRKRAYRKGRERKSLIRWDLLVSGFVLVSVVAVFYTFKLELFLAGATFGGWIVNCVYMFLLENKQPKSDKLQGKTK